MSWGFSLSASMSTQMTGELWRRNEQNLQGFDHPVPAASFQTRSAKKHVQQHQIWCRLFQNFLKQLSWVEVHGDTILVSAEETVQLLKVERSVKYWKWCGGTRSWNQAGISKNDQTTPELHLFSSLNMNGTSAMACNAAWWKPERRNVCWRWLW